MCFCLFFTLFCAVFAREILLCFALFCAVVQKPAHFACILRSAKNSLFALFCSVLHKTEQNFTFCAVLLCFVQSRNFALFCSVLCRAEFLRCFALFCAEQKYCAVLLGFVQSKIENAGTQIVPERVFVPAQHGTSGTARQIRHVT